MKDNRRFVNVDDVARLVYGICFYKSEPMYVCSTSGMRLWLVTLPQIIGQELRADLMQKPAVDDKHLDLSSPELGYMNLPEDGAVYIVRAPKRQIHPLINKDLVGWTGPFGGFQAIGQHLFLSQQFKDMLTKTYPSFNKVFSVAKKPGFMGQAFDKDFCLGIGDPDLTLYMQSKPAGVYQPQHDAFRLEEAYDNSFVKFKLSQLSVPFI